MTSTSEPPQAVTTTMPYVAIVRQFRDATEDIRAPHERRLWRAFPRTPALVWDGLLADTNPGAAAVVLLAPSGSGKSTEFWQQAQRLRSAGDMAVYCEAAAVADMGLEQSLGADERTAWDDWNRSTARLTLFVDAVDELHLRQRSLRDLTRRLETGIDLTRGSVLPVFSARNGSWSVEYTAHVKRLLRRTAGDSDPKIRIVTFEPIDQAALRSLVSAAGVADVDAFVEAFDKDELDALIDLRPCDVSLFVDYWNRRRGFGRWTEILEGFVNSSLEDTSLERQWRQGLPAGEARVALKRIAAANTLMKIPHVTLPTSAAHVGAIRSRRLFDDWPASKLSELFECPLFIHKGTDAVQLPQGALSQYFAARWVSDRAERGWPPEAISEAIFVKVFDDDRVHLPDAKRAVAGWVAPQVEQVRSVLLGYHPQVLLYEGDPARLDDGTVKAGLTALVKKIAEDGRDPAPSYATLKRLARPALEAHVSNLLNDYKRVPAAQRHLIRFAEVGRYRSCLSRAKEVAKDVDGDAIARCAAISMVGTVGDPADKAELNILAGDGDPHVRAALLKALVPDSLQGAELVSFLAAGGEHDFAYLLSHVAGKIAVADLDAALQAILPKLAGRGPDVKPSFEAAVPIVLARLGHVGPFAPIIAEALFAIEQLSDSADHYLGDEERKQLDLALRLDLPLRRALWRTRLDAVDRNEAMFSHISNPRFGDIHEDDFDWLFGIATRRAEPDGRLLYVLDRAYSGLSEERRAAFRSRADLPEALLARLSGVEEQQRELAAGRESITREKELETAEARRKNEAALAERRSRIASGEDLDLLCWGWQHLDANERGTRGRARRNVGRLRDLVGDDLVESFVDGFKACWRRLDAPLREPGNNQVPIVVLVGLTGLTLDIQDGLDLRMLSTSEAELAARYGLYELNNFPFWFDDLIEAHTDAAVNTLRRMLAAEWTYESEHHGVLRFASYAAQRAREAMRRVVLELLEVGPPGHLRTLNYAVDALLTSTADVARIDAIIKRELEASAGSPDRLSEWVRAWIHFAPIAAADWCEHLRAEDRDRFRDVIEKAAALVEEDLDERLSRVSTSGLLAPVALERWIRLLYLGIRPEDDISRESGRIYSPTARDHAQRLRSRCLRRLALDASVQAHAALRRLANDAALAPYVQDFEWGVETQIVQAVQQSDSIWTEEDVLGVEQGDEKCPHTLAELFSIVRSHIRAVGRMIENDDFSYRDLFRDDTLEREIQLWVAATLKQRSHRLYSIVRENVVDDDKEVDISAFADGIGYVPIEIKPLGGYSQKALERVIEEQLLGQYMRPVDRLYGVLLLVRRDFKTWTVNRRRKADLATLVDALQDHATKIGSANGKVIRVEAIDLRFGSDGKIGKAPSVKSFGPSKKKKKSKRVKKKPPARATRRRRR